MKKFKTKKSNNSLKLIMVLFFMLFLIIFILLSNIKLRKNHKMFITYLLQEETFIKEKIDNPLNYLMGNLDFLITNYVFDNLDNQVLVQNNFRYPLIYIYNTHDTEEYLENNNHLSTTVKSASLMLKSNLLVYDIGSIVEERSVYTNLHGQNYSHSYQVSRTFLEEAILKNNTLNYFIDIHRDSVTKEYTQIIINDKEYAKMMFVLGLDNKNYLDNKELMIRLNDYLNTNYNGISRGIYEKSGSGVNGIYNQDFHKNTLLIEIGGVDSNLESVYNSTQILAEALYHIIGDENAHS